MENGRLRETHSDLDDTGGVGRSADVASNNRKLMKFSYAIIKKPSTIVTVDGFGVLLGLA